MTTNMLQQIGSFTARKIAVLSQSNNRAQYAALANLRRGIGRRPGDMPQLWDIIWADMPEELQGSDGMPSRAEWAIYTALTLYALHQQGRDPQRESMNRSATDNDSRYHNSLGLAMAQMIHGEEDQKRVLRRFNIAATSADMTELATHLRSLVQLLKAKSIPLDYPQLAKDLYRYQFPDGAAQVRMRWGQDFYRRINSNHLDNNKVPDNDNIEEDL